MASNDIRIVPCPAPDDSRNTPGTIWWKAVLDGHDLSYIGAYPWELDNALCLCLEEVKTPFIEVKSEMIETVLRYAKTAGYGGVYAITYAKEASLTLILQSLGFNQVGEGRAWSENPTLFWFREGK